MPNVARWANELRAVFGADAMNDAMRRQGYLAIEAGRTIDTRPQRIQPAREVSAAAMVIEKTPPPTVTKNGSARR